MITKFLSNFILTDIRCRKYIFEMNDMSSEKFNNRKRKYYAGIYFDWHSIND